MLYIALCDDEFEICSQLQQCVEKYAQQYHEEVHCEVFLNGEDLYEKLELGQYYDLVFLDIELYLINGVEIGDYIRNVLHNEMMQIVFVSSKTHYAPKLFAIRPMDFIEKPVTYSRVENCLKLTKRAKKHHWATFTYQTGKITKNILLMDILYFESDSRKIMLHHVDGCDIFYEKLDHVQQQLFEQDQPFIRIHKSFLVNYIRAKSFHPEFAVMENGVSLKISRSKQKEVRERIDELRQKGIIEWK